MSEQDNPFSFLSMTDEERRQTREEHPPKCIDAHIAKGYFDWRWKGCGFGQLRFGYDSEKQKWWADTEMMGPEATRELLHAFADYVADQLTPVIEEERRQFEARQNNPPA